MGCFAAGLFAMTGGVTALSMFAPAKLNLFLAVTGRRPDGFHDLVSVVAPLDFGDELACEIRELGNDGARFTLKCDDAAVPVDESNLVLKAAHAYAEASGWKGTAHFTLRKRIPLGAGLGGGSSDAVAALKALNAATGTPLTSGGLESIAARLGSDCPLFLRDSPVVMRGRGERVETFPAAGVRRLAGRRVLIFKPAFGISTPWAYGQMAAKPEMYLPAAEAEARLKAWLDDERATAEKLLFNNMEGAAFAKHLALPTLLEQLRGDHGIAARMSGSGSACFALLRDDTPLPPLMTTIRAAWGETAFIVEGRLTSFAAARNAHANPH